jgi:hypothetical protein
MYAETGVSVSANFSLLTTLSAGMYNLLAKKQKNPPPILTVGLYV